MRSRSRRGSKRSRPNSVQSEDVLPNKVAPQSRHSSAPPPGSKTENFSTPNINEDSTLELDSTPMVKSKSLGLKTPLDTITPNVMRKAANNSDNASTADDEDRSSSPLTERSSNSDFTMGPVAEYTPTTTNTKPGARTYEDLPESNPQTLGTTPDRASAPASITGPTPNGQLSDSSSLSELEDSEAETERLDLSPHKNTFQNPLHNAGKLPSGRNFSMLSEKPATLNFDDDQLNHLRANLEDMTEELTPEGSVREPSVGPEQKKRKVDDMEARDEDESFQGTPRSIAKSPKDGDEDITMKDETSLTDDEVQDNGSPSKESDDVVTPSRVHLPNGNTPKSQMKTPIDQHRNAKEVVDDSSNEEVDDNNESPSKDTDNGDVEASGETELDNDAAREEEEGADAEILRIKKAAAEEMKNIETLFAQLRDKLVEERVSDIDREIAMINDGTHPELILMARSVEERRDQKTHAADVLLRHQREAQERHIVATKAAIHSQYYQEVRQLREDALSKVNTMWFAIHRERRAADTNVNDFVFKIPKQLSTQYRHRAAYNKEVSLLSGIAKYVGFPAAPEIQGASLDDTRSDLEAMGLASHSQVPFSSHVLNHPHMHPFTTSLQPSAFAGPSQSASSSHKQTAIAYYNQKAMLENPVPVESVNYQARPRSPISPLIAPKPIAVPQQPAREFAYSAQQLSPPDAGKNVDQTAKPDYLFTPPQSSKSTHSRQHFVHGHQTSAKSSSALSASTYDTSLDSIFGLGNHNARGTSIHDGKSTMSHSVATFRPASPGWDPMSNGSYTQSDLYDSLEKEKSNAPGNVHASETHLKDEIRAGGSRYY